MSQKALIGGQQSWLSQTINRIDWLWGLGLLLAAIVLFGINLGSLPLRDWDEGLVAQVARTIWRSSHDLTWLYPTMGGEPYFNKPPLMHLLIAAVYHWQGVQEWTTRLPGATFTTLSVPLLYAVGRELFHRRTPALFAAVVYLTSLPVVRQGRLAMLDGAVLCFLLLTVWCLLRARRDSRYALGVGLGLGLICLVKGLMMAGILGAIALLFLGWDTPRLLGLPYLWGGMILGCLPACLWYTAQWWHYGIPFLTHNLLDQSLSRIWSPVENHQGPPWYYLVTIAEYGFPWVLFLPLAGKLTWEHRNLSWAKLVMVWAVPYLVAISLMATKLPWYALPLYPALSLAIGAQLTALWQKGLHPGIRQPLLPYSRLWFSTFVLLGVVGWAGSFYYGTGAEAEPDLAAILAAIALTMTVAAILIIRQDPEFLVVLVWGTYVSLLLLMLSNHWVWELAEAYPVKPVAAIVQQHTLVDTVVYTSYPNNRPSLNFYSDRQVVPASSQQLQQHWREDSSPYLLLDSNTLQTLNLDSQRVLGTAEGLTLITRY
jgi:4-amino-4-deoxy-L-arabinose transferase-like glycosyltransferase